MRHPTGDGGYRAALESTIVESDDLIRTFDALLMIARADPDRRANMAEFDAAEIARDVGDLYEPLAEEKGIALDGRGQRHGAGAGQPRIDKPALANLVDNAIKYAGPNDKLNGTPAEIDQGRRRG